MNNSKGFTLVELLAVISILSIISLIAIPTIGKTISSSRQKAYDAQINTIKIGMKEWGSENIYALPKVGGTIDLTLNTLKKGGYVDSDIENPKTNKPFNNTCTIGTIANDGGKLVYTVKILPSPCDNSTTLTLVSRTKTSATVSSSLATGTGTIKKYEFKIETGGWVDNGTTNTYTFTDLSNQIYKAYARITTTNGNVYEAPIININMSNLTCTYTCNGVVDWFSNQNITNGSTTVVPQPPAGQIYDCTSSSNGTWACRIGRCADVKESCQ